MMRTLILALLALALAGCIAGDVWFKFSGTVADPSGRPIEGVKVSIFVDGKLIENGTEVTDELGNYKFFVNSCPCDFDFMLRAEAPGFKPYSLSMPGSQANQLLEQDITLQPR
jgi:hypothetical protein